MLGICKARRITVTRHNTCIQGLGQKLQVIHMAMSRNMLLVLARLQQKQKELKITDKMAKKSGALRPMNKLSPVHVCVFFV